MRTSNGTQFAVLTNGLKYIHYMRLEIRVHAYLSWSLKDLAQAPLDLRICAMMACMYNTTTY